MSKYDDIIHLPHHVSRRHPPMPVSDRAAQFSPFAALTGYDAVVKEAARLTHRRIELSDDEKAVLDERLRLLADALPHSPEAAFTYFLPDSRKDGGAYVTAAGRLKRADTLRRVILLTDGTQIPIDDVLDIQIEPGFYPSAADIPDDAGPAP